MTIGKRRRGWGIAAVAVVVLGAAFAGHQMLSATTAPSCSWPAHIQDADPVQDGLIRCYLRAIADRSTTELQSVVPTHSEGGPIGFGSAAFAHAADVRSGPATVTVIGNSVDDADATVAIRYADQAQDSLEIHLADPASAKSWRFWNLGIFPPDPNAPPPVIR